MQREWRPRGIGNDVALRDDRRAQDVRRE